LHGDVKVGVPDLAAEEGSGSLPNTSRNMDGLRLHNIEEHLGDLDSEMIRSRLVIPGDENLPFATRKATEEVGPSLPPQQPRPSGEVIINASMQGP
jgi:hypothetical protein